MVVLLVIEKVKAASAAAAVVQLEANFQSQWCLTFRCIGLIYQNEPSLRKCDPTNCDCVLHILNKCTKYSDVHLFSALSASDFRQSLAYVFLHIIRPVVSETFIFVRYLLGINKICQKVIIHIREYFSMFLIGVISTTQFF